MISRPLNLGSKSNRRWACVMSLLTWLYSALFASLPLFGVGKYVPEGYLTGCSFDYLSNELSSKIFVLVFFIGAWMVPLIIIIYSYSSIIGAVAHVRRDVVQANQSEPRSLTSTGAAAALILSNDPAPNQAVTISNGPTSGKNIRTYFLSVLYIELQ